MAGRKSKLTQELIDEAVKLIKAGNYNETVCQFLGIHKSTWYKWLQEGEAAKSGLKREFFDSIKKAESHSEIRNVQVIQKAAQDGNWQAAMTYLERKFPDKWGRKDKISSDVNHSGEIQKKEEHTVTHKIDMYEEAFNRVVERSSNVKLDE